MKLTQAFHRLLNQWFHRRSTAPSFWSSCSRWAPSVTASGANADTSPRRFVALSILAGLLGILRPRRGISYPDHLAVTPRPPGGDHGREIAQLDQSDHRARRRGPLGLRRHAHRSEKGPAKAVGEGIALALAVMSIGSLLPLRRSRLFELLPSLGVLPLLPRLEVRPRAGLRAALQMRRASPRPTRGKSTRCVRASCATSPKTCWPRAQTALDHPEECRDRSPPSVGRPSKPT